MTNLAENIAIFQTVLTNMAQDNILDGDVAGGAAQGGGRPGLRGQAQRRILPGGRQRKLFSLNHSFQIYFEVFSGRRPRI